MAGLRKPGQHTRSLPKGTARKGYDDSRPEVQSRVRCPYVTRFRRPATTMPRRVLRWSPHAWRAQSVFPRLR